MRLLGLIPEPPFDPRSWSGSAAHFFRAIDRQNLLEAAAGVQLSNNAERWHQIRAWGWPLSRWREQYHASTARFQGLTRLAAREIARHPNATGVLQIGAWFSAPATTALPCFSYHDGNAALWYRYYGRGLLSDARLQRHLDWERRNYHRMSSVFVMSQWLGNSFIEDFGMPQERVHVVGAGINFDRLPALPERSDPTPRFLFVGRDFVRKGGQYLLEAFRRTRSAAPNAELHIVGPDPGPPEPGVHYAGFLSKSDPAGLAKLQELFKRCTVTVLPSIYEPFGISLLEGMAFGQACVAVNRCAMPEIVTHRQTGLVANAEDSASLAEAMTELALDPDRIRAMGLQGRAKVEQHFTWDAVAGKISAMLSR